MKIRPRAILFACLLVFLATLPANAARKPQRVGSALKAGSLSTEQQADSMWREGSFRRALMLYQKALKQGKTRNPDLAQLRVAAVLVNLGHFNTGVQQGLQLLSTTPGKARVLYWLGRAYAQADHEGYKIKGVLHRGYSGYLYGLGDEQTGYIDLSRIDNQKTLDYFEDAKRRAAQERAAHAPNALTADEEIDLNFDLATWLPKVAGGRFIRGLAKKSPAAFDEKVDPAQPYNRDWSLPKKVLFLYNEIRRLDNSPDRLPAARALLAKGSFADTYRASMDFWALPLAEKKVFSETRPQGVRLWNLDKPAAKKPVVHPRPYPFRYLNPVAIWTQLVREFPNGPYADSTLLLIASWQMRHDEPARALQTYQRVARDYPKSPRLGNARQAIDQLTLSSIEFRPGKPQPTGQNAEITLQTHNTPLLRFIAYRVRLESLFKSLKQTDDGSDNLQKAVSRLGPLAQLQRRLGSPIKKWTLRTADRNDYRHVRQTVAIPLSQNGAYLVVAEARGVHYVRLVLVTDLALIKKLDRSSGLFYAADARTGKPVGNINVLVTEVRRTREGRRPFQLLGKTDASGLYTSRLTSQTMSCQALVWSGNRYAYTSDQVFQDWRYGYGDESNENRKPQNFVYSYTDRPIYRPGQKVYYREIVTHRDDNGINTLLKNRKVKITIGREGSDDVLLEKTFVTSSFGTVNGSIALPAELRLGTYSVDTEIERTRKIGNISEKFWEPGEGSGSFRVEEYKRPEFVVTLTPPAAAARPGDTIRAKVSVRYYTGGAVPGARVKWHVERSQWRAAYHFPTSFDWLSDQWSDTPNYYGTSSYRSPRLKERPKRDGVIVTDTKGEAEIVFIADKDHFCDNKPGDWTDNLTNPSYSISAEVTDSSRRAVQAAGETRVSAQRYFAFLQPERGFTTAGSAVQVNIAARNANDQPVAASGRITVYHEESVPDSQPEYPYSARTVPQKPAETAVHAENITVDETGLAYWDWTPDSAGYFRIAYEGQDNDGHNIVASTFVWVAGNGLDTRPIAKDGLAVTVEKLSYEEGETARVLLVCDKPDATILLTQETGTKILRKQLVALKGKSAIIEIPILRSHAPNFVIAAVAVNDYQVFRAAVAVVVPNTRSSLQINVESDKETYKPGEKGIFTITALDRDGAPARAEVSLALTDASLYALEGDNAPDMMAFYFGNLRDTSVFADSFLSANYPARGERDGKPHEYTSWNLNLPRAFGQLHIEPVDYTDLIRSSTYGDYERANDFSDDQSDISYWQQREEIEQDISLSRPGQALYPVFGIEPRCEEEPAPVRVPKEDDFRTMSLMDAIANMLGASRRVQTVFNVANNSLTTTTGGEDEAGSADGRVKWPIPREAPVQFSDKFHVADGTPAMSSLSQAMAGHWITPPAPLAPAHLRSNFAETAFWAPAVVTENGKAKVEVTFPDTLTEWHAGARGLTEQVQVGTGERNVITNKSLRVRLQSPRFFTQRDHVLLTANISNDLKTDKHIKVSLQTASNLQVMPQSSSQWGNTLPAASGFVNVKAGSEATVNWLVNVVRPGTASVQMTAQSDEESDAVKMSFPVVVHGASRLESSSGVMGPANWTKPLSKTVRFTMPAARQKGASRLVVQVNPSIAATMLDAIPYLADYPYGCVEQTMSRFLPAAAAQGALQRNGVNLQELKQRIRHEANAARTAAAAAGIKNTGYSYPRGVPGARDAAQFARDWSNTDRYKNPVYDPVVLHRMVHEGLQRLAQMQRGDGGWGWWPDSPESDDYMTAYVVSGLQILRQQQISSTDAALLQQLSARGVRYLRNVMHLEANQRETDWEMVAQYAYAISQAGQSDPGDTRLITGRLFQIRARLTPYSQAMLAFSLATIGEKAKAAVVIRNMENTVKVDNATGTARWMTGSNEWWQWWNNGVETNALALRAFLKADPHNKLTPMLMKWLLIQARGGHWRSTKETALAVLALADYVKVNRELDVDCTVTVRLGDRLQRTFRITRTNALTFDNRFIADDSLLSDGANTLSISVKGKGRAYWNVSREYFSLEEPIRASGSQISITRRYFKINDAGGKRWRTPLKDGDALRSGDHVEVELALHSANTFDYLVFEDMKPAGLEAIEVHSGSQWNGDLVSNIEWRDDKVALFLDSLPPGNHTLRYEMRAEVPGSFHALPTNGYAMYAPEVRATSQEMRLGIRDAVPQ